MLAPLMRIEAPKHRYSSIDGLRGFLAMFVFLHHSAIWFYFSHMHEWSHIPSDLFNQFGSTSVAFFFMITAFLFFSKLINSFSGTIDWTKLYVSRIMRIMPLYLLAVFIMVVVIGFLSHFTLNEPLQNLLQHLFQWSFFMEPDINKIYGTRFINSGVQWSLTYEWSFYCCLAIIGWLFFRIKTSPVIIILTIAFLIIFLIIIHEYYSFREWKRIFTFIPGIIGAFLSRNEKVRKVCSDQSSTLFLIVLPCVVLFYYPTIFEPIPFLCAAIIFFAIASGNTIFGLLTCKPSLLLGQISYSIYLLHGIILFFVFHFVIGTGYAEKLPILTYWSIISLCAVVVTVVSAFSYIYVEKTGIDSSANITHKIKVLFKKRKNNYLAKSEATL